jgi:hypothetical protein
MRVADLVYFETVATTYLITVRSSPRPSRYSAGGGARTAHYDSVRWDLLGLDPQVGQLQ